MTPVNNCYKTSQLSVVSRWDWQCRRNRRLCGFTSACHGSAQCWVCVLCWTLWLPITGCQAVTWSSVPETAAATVTRWCETYRRNSSDLEWVLGLLLLKNVFCHVNYSTDSQQELTHLYTGSKYKYKYLRFKYKYKYYVQRV